MNLCFFADGFVCSSSHNMFSLNIESPYLSLREGSQRPVCFLSSQQSSLGSAPAPQLSVPHTRSPAQWLCWSQSPSPTPHGAAALQQL